MSFAALNSIQRVRPQIWRPPPNLLPDPWVRDNFAVRYANLSTAFILIEEHLGLFHPMLMVPWEDIVFVFPSFVFTDPYCQSFAQWYPPGMNLPQNQTAPLSAHSTFFDPAAAAANSNQHPAPENPQPNPAAAADSQYPHTPPTSSHSHSHSQSQYRFRFPPQPKFQSQFPSQPELWDYSRIAQHPIRLSEWPMKWINNLLVIMETFRSIKSKPLFAFEDGFNMGERDPFSLWYLAAACAQAWTRGPCGKLVGGNETKGEEKKVGWEKDISEEELRRKTEEVYWEARKVNGSIWWEYHSWFCNMVEQRWWEAQMEAWNQNQSYDEYYQVGTGQVEGGVQNHKRDWALSGVEDGVEYYEEVISEDNVGEGWEGDNLPDGADTYVEDHMGDKLEETIEQNVEGGMEDRVREAMEKSFGEAVEKIFVEDVEEIVEDNVQEGVEDNQPDNADNHAEDHMEADVKDNQEDHAEDYNEEVRYHKGYDSGCCGMKEEPWEGTLSKNADDNGDTSSDDDDGDTSSDDDEAVLTPSESGFEEIRETECPRKLELPRELKWPEESGPCLKVNCPLQNTVKSPANLCGALPKSRSKTGGGPVREEP